MLKLERLEPAKIQEPQQANAKMCWFGSAVRDRRYVELDPTQLQNALLRNDTLAADGLNKARRLGGIPAPRESC
jgi:hypothetical protein